MKTLFVTLALVLTSQFAFAAHDGMLGNCQVAAQKALTALNKINRSQKEPIVVIVGEPGQVETWTEYSEAPQYTIITNVGMNGRCAVESIQFNPQP